MGGAVPGPDEVDNWVCPMCKCALKRTAPNCTTPVRALDSIDHLNVTFRRGTRALKGNSEDDLTLENIGKLIDAKLLGLRASLREDIQSMVAAEVKNALQVVKEEFTETTDFIVAEQLDIKKGIASRDKNISSLETEQLRLQSEILSLNSRLSTMEKISRDCNLEIHMVPENHNENVMDLFNKLCKCIDVLVPENDVRHIRRVAKKNPKSDRPRNILATLTSPRIRDTVLSAAHRFNKANKDDKLSSGHIGLSGKAQRIYLNEHISPESKDLHAAARKVAKEKKYKHVWVKYGQVYVRKNDDADAIRIASINSLESLQ